MNYRQRINRILSDLSCLDMICDADTRAVVQRLRNRYPHTDSLGAAGSLDECLMHLDDDISDTENEPAELPEPNGGRGEFDAQSGAVPLWMTTTAGH